MLPDGRRLGAHLAMGDGLVKAADRAAEIGLSALQIFSDNPTAWRRRAEPSPEIPAFRERLVRAGIAPLVIHGAYLINPATADPENHERSVTLLAAELQTARLMGARLVNIHIGSHGGAGVEAGIERLVDAVGRAIATVAASDGSAPAMIVLENSAGSGSGLGVDLDELAAIARALDDAGLARDRVGFCLDTAHAWAAGHEMSDPAAADTLIEGFDRRIGIDRLSLVHLNDTRSQLGSRMDRHEHIGAGRIGESGMTHLLRHPLLAGATYILETPGMDEGYDAINVARVLALVRGEALEPLPPGAFTLPGSRTRAAIPVDPPPEVANDEAVTDEAATAAMAPIATASPATRMDPCGS